ncbi:MAG: hypothetical protein V4556_09490 [Bacteroidota bacterium]
MKKIILSVLLTLTICTITNAQEIAASSTKYVYYPTKNVYYNEATETYLYYDRPTRGWIAVDELPSSYVVNKEMNHYEVTYNGTDVWKENKRHTMIYKVKKDGKVKVRTQYASN